MPLKAATRDLRAPLVRLRQLLLEMSVCGASDVNLQQAIGTLGEALGIVDALQIAQLSPDQLSLRPIAVDQLFGDINQRVAPVAHAMQRKFVCQCPRRSAVLLGDYQALVQFLTRSAIDALKYSTKPVKLSARVTRRREVVLAISDQSRSSDLPDQANLTRRLNPWLSRPLASTLNLIIAESLTQAMQGRITWRRRRSGGVTMEAHLPESHQLSLWSETCES